MCEANVGDMSKILSPKEKEGLETSKADFQRTYLEYWSGSRSQLTSKHQIPQVLGQIRPNCKQNKENPTQKFQFSAHRALHMEGKKEKLTKSPLFHHY